MGEGWIVARVRQVAAPQRCAQAPEHERTEIRAQLVPTRFLVEAGGEPRAKGWDQRHPVRRGAAGAPLLNPNHTTPHPTPPLASSPTTPTHPPTTNPRTRHTTSTS